MKWQLSVMDQRILRLLLAISYITTTILSKTEKLKLLTLCKKLLKRLAISYQLKSWVLKRLDQLP
jgi:hypothetical protein